MLSLKTTVTTVEGKTIEFGDAASKFIVAHPKTATIVALILGNVVGAIFHV